MAQYRQVTVAPGQTLRVRLAPIDRQTVLSDTVTVVDKRRGDLNIPRSAWDAGEPKGQ